MLGLSWILKDQCTWSREPVISRARLISKWLHVIRFFASPRVHCVSEIITGDIEKKVYGKKCSKILWMKIFVSCTSYKITSHCHFSSWEAFSFEWCNVIQYISCVCLQPSGFRLCCCCCCDKLDPFVNNLYSYIQILLTWVFHPSLWRWDALKIFKGCLVFSETGFVRTSLTKVGPVQTSLHVCLSFS